MDRVGAPAGLADDLGSRDKDVVHYDCDCDHRLTHKSLVQHFVARPVQHVLYALAGDIDDGWISLSAETAKIGHWLLDHFNTHLESRRSYNHRNSNNNHNE